MSAAFCIASGRGYALHGTRGVEAADRNAEVFASAWHPRSGDDADHTAPAQWTFFVVAEPDRPRHQRTIRRAVLGRGSRSVTLDARAEALRRAIEHLPPPSW
jgi:hypothetical protein